MNRKDRRSNEIKQSKKIKRQIDWKKVSKLFKEMLLIGFGLTIIIFCFSYYIVTIRNGLRESVAEKPQISTAKVAYISRKGVRKANYEYIVNGKKYKNSTFHSFEGSVGSEICIEYSLINPTFSIIVLKKKLKA